MRNRSIGLVAVIVLILLATSGCIEEKKEVVNEFSGDNEEQQEKEIVSENKYAENSDKPDAQPNTGIKTDTAKYTKISDLLSNPRYYDGKIVTIRGGAFTQNLRPRVCIPDTPVCVDFDFSILKVTDTDGSSLCVSYFGSKRYEGTVVVEGKLRSADAVYGNVKDELFKQKADVRTIITVNPVKIYQDRFTARADVKVTVYDQIKGTDISRKIAEKTQTVKITDNIAINDVKIYIAGVDALATDSITVSVWKGQTPLTGNPLVIKEGESRTFEEVTLRDISDFADETTFDLKGELRKTGGDVCAGDYVFIASKIEEVGG